MGMSAPVVSRLLGYWGKTEVKSRPGLSTSKINAWESEHGVRLPSDLRSIYLATNGMEHGTTDAHLLHLWPLEELDTLDGLQFLPPDLSDWNNWYVFADTYIDA